MVKTMGQFTEMSEEVRWKTGKVIGTPPDTIRAFSSIH